VNLDASRQYHRIHNAYDSSITCITNIHDIEEGRDKLLTSSCVVDPRSVDVLRVLCWTNIFIVVNLDTFYVSSFAVGTPQSNGIQMLVMFYVHY
jgi:hypothetical protein